MRAASATIAPAGEWSKSIPGQDRPLPEDTGRPVVTRFDIAALAQGRFPSPADRGIMPQ